MSKTTTYLPTPPSEPDHHTSTPTTAENATIYLPTPFHPRAEKYAEEKFGKVLRNGVDGKEEELLSRADGILLRIGNMHKPQLDLAPNLKAICRNGTGLDMIDLDECVRRGIMVTNVPGGNAKEVAELTIALSLIILRRIKESDYLITSGQRTPSITVLSPGLMGKTVGLIGMGDIAYEAAKLFLAFGCKIIIWSPTSPLNKWEESQTTTPNTTNISHSSTSKYIPIPHIRVNSLNDLLPNIDILSIHCPLTSSTKNLIGYDQLKSLRKGSILINTARGGIVDEIALIKVLDQGILFGAGLDVFNVEPAFGENLGELGKRKNIVCLPHIGSSTDEGTYIGCIKAIDEMVDILNGKPPKHPVR
ncbi:hypothetical protein TREMEDRAFT_45917 [Tremella mesenterica DSM 1558]|uniref:uncharacterized protein n=1 Tax=Tremella mesenterica (strain ATCC 24925 / CBS 8224 / DSM 1558 / NBRC 9311 / NRRL Y-6157 / RJB 2259-6 / UBC 559-6) TaxID=578456 RepID=UPI00032BB890|nr:uncharacterized protein TREMEDRAFT_45917 [Tremella mesenterica DSM 1558]EIW66079.1 hypothetical protein TREMEDRAFT_45917 [Tremella mesenterica DSM 1558]